MSVPSEFYFPSGNVAVQTSQLPILVGERYTVPLKSGLQDNDNRKADARVDSCATGAQGLGVCTWVRARLCMSTYLGSLNYSVGLA